MKFTLREQALTFPGFFVWRIPLLSLEELRDLRPSATSAPGAWTPLLREGLRLASRELFERLGDVASPGSSSQSGAKSLYDARQRYLVRAATRPTPFGLFGAWVLGRSGTNSHLELLDRGSATRHSRLDAAALEALVRGLRRHDLPIELRSYRRNPTIHRTREHLRYIAPTEDGGYEASSVDRHETIDQLLDSSIEHRSAATLVEQLCTLGLERDEASELFEELVDAGLLLDDLDPPLTTLNPLGSLIETISRGAPNAPVLKHLRDLDRGLHALDHTMVPPDADYQALDRCIGQLPLDTPSRCPVHVDVFRPAHQATLGDDVVRAMAQSIEALRRFGSPSTPSALDAFIERFIARFGDDEIPLPLAVDEEDGVGFDAVHRPEHLHPLAGGLQRQPSQTPVAWGERERRLVRRLEAADRSGEQEIVIDDDDLAACPQPAPLPSSFAFHGAILADPAQLARNRFCLVCDSWSGPPATRTLGRVAHLCTELDTSIAALLRAEEHELEPALVAEIVHRPTYPERMANVTRRARLRPYEIDCLGPASAPGDTRIPLDDLLLSMRDGRLTLRSRRLGRTVIPRMSTAHNSTQPWHLPAYRLLCQLHYTGAGSQRWSWAPFDGRRFFPRVRYANAILSPATWSFPGAELCATAEIDDWRDRWRLPRWVTVDGLFVDLESPEQVRSTFGHARNKPLVRLQESLAMALGTPSHGPEGHYVHELIVPFIRHHDRPPRPPAPRPPRARTDVQHAPGSSWLQVNIFAGGRTLDELLTGPLANAVESMTQSGNLTGWFYLRQGDPDRHLRLRLRGDPSWLQREAWPALQHSLAPHLAARAVHRVQLDTYQPEIDRYGEREGLRAVESMFHADSIATVAMLRHATGTSEEQSYRALVSLDRLLDDLGLDPAQKLRVAHDHQEFLLREHNADLSLKREIGARHRERRSVLESLWSATPPPFIDQLQPILDERSQIIRTATAALHRALDQGLATRDPAVLAPSLLHLHVNRLFHFPSRALEMVLMTFLCRLYRTRLARAR